ncbi:MAG: hypothetical protein QM820_26505 [Minicystis sp.]
MRSLAPFAIVPFLAACGPTSPTPEIPPAPTASAAAPLASATASAAPATTAAPAEPPEPPSPFFPVVVGGDASLRFFPLAKGGVAINGQWLSVPIVVDERGARVEAKLFEGLKGEGEQNAFAVNSVSGDWPRSGSIEINLPGERGGTDMAYTWSGAKWIKAKDQPLADMSTEVMRAYYGGSLVGRARWGDRTLYSLLDHTGDSGAVFPKFVLGGRGGGKPPAIAAGSGDCPTRLVPHSALTTTPWGDMMGVSKLCTGPNDYGYLSLEGPGALAVEVWAKGARKSTVMELPGSAGKGMLVNGNAGVAGSGRADVYVYATFNTQSDTPTPYVAHWDGKAWTDVTPATKSAIRGISVDKSNTAWIETAHELFRRKGDSWERRAPDGVEDEIALHAVAPDQTHWVRFGKVLWHLGPNDAWEKVSLPRAPGAERSVVEGMVWVGGDLMMIVSGDALKGNGLVSSKKPEKVLDLSAEEAGGAQKKEAEKKVAFGRVGPPTAGCKNLFVVLYKLSRVAPPDFDFPLTREALKGHTEFADVRFAETEDGGSRYLVAFVPNLKRGQKLLGLVADKVKNAKPQMLCGEPPRTNRVINIDLRTGELKK